MQKTKTLRRGGKQRLHAIELNRRRNQMSLSKESLTWHCQESNGDRLQGTRKKKDHMKSRY